MRGIEGCSTIPQPYLLDLTTFLKYAVIVHMHDCARALYLVHMHVSYTLAANVAQDSPYQPLPASDT